MQGPQNLFFTPDPNIPYKIISVMDPKKAFTLHGDAHKLVISDYQGAPDQLFTIFQNNQKYAFVNPATDSALHVEKENKGDGGVVSSNSGQFQSSFFHIVPVTKGDWAGKACHINTFSEGKSLDIKGGKPNANNQICQWKFHGNVNQQWLVIPADNIQHGDEKVQAQEEIPEVPAEFQPKPKTAYKIVSVLDDEKCLTVSKDNKLEIHTFKKQKSQKFEIHWDQGKFAFVCASNDSGLCIFQDKQDNGAEIITDGGKHSSSWFTISRADKGKWSHKAYLIKTHAGNRAFDIAGGKAEEGKKVLQYNIHQGENQLWLIEPFAEEKKKKKDNKKDNKKAAKDKKVVVPDVAPNVEVNGDQLFKISSVLNKNLVLTLNKESKLVLDKHHNKPNQHFNLHFENNKFAIVDKKSKSGLCIFQDKADDNTQIIGDSGKHNSSWFQIVRSEKGPYAHKGYIIKTHAGKCLDVRGGKAEDGTQIIQYNIHEGGNQVWLVEPLNTGKGKAKKQPFNNWQTEVSNIHQIVPQTNQGNNQGMGFVQNAQFKPEQNYIIYAIHGGNTKCLDIAQDMMNHGQLIMYSFHGAPNQRFVFEQEGGMVRIRNVQEKKYLNVTHDIPNEGMWIRCDEKGTAQSELWTVVPATDPKYAGKGAYHIRSIFGLALTSPKSSLDNSVHIQQDKFRCQDGQTWIIKQI